MSGQQQYVRLCIPMRSGQCNKTATFGHNGRGSVGGVRGCVDRGRGGVSRKSLKITDSIISSS